MTSEIPPFIVRIGPSREGALRGLCERHGLALETAAETAGAEELRRRLAAARGVVCDLSGDPGAAWLALGFALALNLPALLLTRPDAPLPVAAAALPRCDPEDPETAAQTLDRWLGGLAADGAPLLARAIPGLPFAARVLEGDGRQEYVYDPTARRSPFVFEETGEPFTLDRMSRLRHRRARIGETSLTDETISLLRRVHQLQVGIAEASGRPFHPGELLGYLGHTPLRDEEGERFGARLRVRRTDYFTFVATHYPLQAVADARRLGLLGEAQGAELEDRLRRAMAAPDWPWASALTVSFFLIAELPRGPRLLLQNRDVSKNFHARYPKQATAAGMIHPSRIADPEGGHTSVELAFVHELAEETGVRLPRERLRLLGLVREEVTRECGFVAYTRVSRRELEPAALPIDAFEAESFDAVPFTPDGVADYLRRRTGGGRDVIPLALTGLALVLVRHFGLPVTRDILHQGTGGAPG